LLNKFFGEEQGTGNEKSKNYDYQLPITHYPLPKKGLDDDIDQSNPRFHPLLSVIAIARLLSIAKCRVILTEKLGFKPRPRRAAFSDLGYTA
jgi:hypothetical protein